MKRLIAILVIVLVSSGCLARSNVYKRVRHPNGAVTEYNDRIMAIVEGGELTPEQVEVIKAILAREEAGGERWKEIISMLDQAALIALVGSFAKR